MNRADKKAETLARLNAPSSTAYPVKPPASEYTKGRALRRTSQKTVAPVLLDLAARVGGFTKVRVALKKKRRGRPRKDQADAERAERDRKYYHLEDSYRADVGARYLPNPDEIAEAAAIIRAGWSERETASRCQLPGREPAELKVIHVIGSGRLQE